LEEHSVKETFLFELGGVDLILGMTWLASLGEVKVNWRTLTMSFNTVDHQVQIKGDLTLTKKVVTPQVLLKETEIEAITLVWELGVTEMEEAEVPSTNLPPKQEELRGVLQEYKGIF